MPEKAQQTKSFESAHSKFNGKLILPFVNFCQVCVTKNKASDCVNMTLSVINLTKIVQFIFSATLSSVIPRKVKATCLCDKNYTLFACNR